jgi:hypothetical protein
MKEAVFFEKKNKKTFNCLGALAWRGGAIVDCLYEQKFFVSFFQKRDTSFLRKRSDLYASWHQAACNNAG